MKNFFKLIFVLLITGIVVFGIFGYKLVTLYQYDKKFDNLDLDQQTTYSDKKVDNIMLFGVDADENGTRRSDAMMIMSLDYEDHKIKLISLMRDSYVQVPGYGRDKLTNSYSYGGPELTIKTINENFGMNISEYATVNFGEMAAIVDAVGGVNVNVTKAERKEANKYIEEYGRTYGVKVHDIEKTGMQTLDGVQAMTYGRIRKDGTGDDWGRVERQSVVLQAIFDKLKSSSPFTLYHTAQKILPNVTSSLSKDEVGKIVGQFLLHPGKPTMEHIRIPVDGEWEGKKIHGVYYTVFNRDKATNEIYDYIYYGQLPGDTNS